MSAAGDPYRLYGKPFSSNEFPLVGEEVVSVYFAPGYFEFVRF